MHTCNVTYFKNHALKMLDEINKKHEELLITRHGKPLATISPISNEIKEIELGKLKGSMAIEGDIISPVGENDWEASQ